MIRYPEKIMEAGIEVEASEVADFVFYQNE
jgi:hypothetical protein